MKIRLRDVKNAVQKYVDNTLSMLGACRSTYFNPTEESKSNYKLLNESGRISFDASDDILDYPCDILKSIEVEIPVDDSLHAILSKNINVSAENAQSVEAGAIQGVTSSQLESLKKIQEYRKQIPPGIIKKVASSESSIDRDRALSADKFNEIIETSRNNLKSANEPKMPQTTLNPQGIAMSGGANPKSKAMITHFMQLSDHKKGYTNSITNTQHNLQESPYMKESDQEAQLLVEKAPISGPIVDDINGTKQAMQNQTVKKRSSGLEEKIKEEGIDNYIKSRI